MWSNEQRYASFVGELVLAVSTPMQSAVVERMFSSEEGGGILAGGCGSGGFSGLSLTDTDCALADLVLAKRKKDVEEEEEFDDEEEEEDEDLEEEDEEDEDFDDEDEDEFEEEFDDDELDDDDDDIFYDDDEDE